jgi:PAS domain S-box-containing protein
MVMMRPISNPASVIKRVIAPNAQLEHERLTSLINSMADGVLAVDTKGRVVLHNGAALNILDSNTIADNAPLEGLLKLTDKENKPVNVTELVRKTLLATSSRDYRLAYKDGSVINVYLSIAPVRLGYGTTGEQGYVLLLRDITHEKSLEEERDEFISVVSHELRTPIAIAEGNLSNARFIAEKSGNIEEIKKALHQAHGQVLFLADMINDLAMLSRAERGKLTVDIEPINVHDLVMELANSYTPEAQKKGLELRVQLSPQLELLQSSRLYVREILQNFVTNALKYTQEGSVTIGAKPVKDGVEFEVTDTGIGISKSDQEKVFEKFFRSEDYRTRATNGTGLGLYVTLKLAKLLHTTVALQSELNKGSTFTITVPDLKVTT